MMRIVFTGFTGVLATGFLAGTARGQWAPARRLSTDAEAAAGAQIKGPRIYSSAFGGFHTTYTAVHPNGPTNIQYRRAYRDGTLGAGKTIDGAGFNYNPEIAEAGDGSVHVVWENWADGPAVGWSHSTYGGATFSAPVELATGHRSAKHPLIEQLGPSHSRKIVMTYFRTDRGDLRFQQFNGAGWTTDLWLGSRGSGGGTDYWAHSEYEVLGSARNPRDGSVYRLYDDELNGDEGNFVTYTRFDPVTNRWGPAEHVFQENFFARAAIAVNDRSDVMVVWDADDTSHFRVRTAAGWGPVMTNVFGGAFFGDIVGIPGTNDFYVVNTNASRSGAFGRLYDGETGAWGPVEDVNPGQVDSFTADLDLAADPNGTVYAVWEYWGPATQPGGDFQPPQAWFSARTAAAAVPEPGALAGLVVALPLLLRRRRRPVAAAGGGGRACHADSVDCPRTPSISLRDAV